MRSTGMSVLGIACSTFRKEIEWLLENERTEIPFIYVDSKLHMNPSKLDRRLRSVIHKGRQRSKAIVLVFGECCPSMANLESEAHVTRIRAVNCYEILLGKSEYRRLCRERAFFLMREWAMRWQVVFQKDLGLQGDNFRSLMTEMHKKLVYLDTGLAPIPKTDLEEISHYSGLPVEIVSVSLDGLLTALKLAQKKVAME